MTCEDCVHDKVCVIKAFPDAFENTQWEKDPCDHFAKASGWISVDERLPDTMQKVLAYRGEFRGGMKNVYTHLGNGNWEDDYSYRSSTEYEGITHWMPLPEPPKGE